MFVGVCCECLWELDMNVCGSLMWMFVGAWCECCWSLMKMLWRAWCKCLWEFVVNDCGGLIWMFVVARCECLWELDVNDWGGPMWMLWELDVNVCGSLMWMLFELDVNVVWAWWKCCGRLDVNVCGSLLWMFVGVCCECLWELDMNVCGSLMWMLLRLNVDIMGAWWKLYEIFFPWYFQILSSYTLSLWSQFFRHEEIKNDPVLLSNVPKLLDIFAKLLCKVRSRTTMCNYLKLIKSITNVRMGFIDCFRSVSPLPVFLIPAVLTPALILIAMMNSAHFSQVNSSF